MIICFIANNIAWIIFLIFFLAMTEVDYPVMPEPEWAKPRDKKMQSTVWPVSVSLEFVPFMFVDEKTLPCSFEDVTFFSELKSKTENNVTKSLHFYYQQGC